MKKQYMSQDEFMHKHSYAFEALPECYQNDHCLQFFIEEGELFCKPLDNQVSILGDWVCKYNGKNWNLWADEYM